jgi:hypothetical protein
VKLEAMAEEVRHTSREPLTKAQAMVQVMKTSEGRELAAAYRQRTRD